MFGSFIQTAHGVRRQRASSNQLPQLLRSDEDIRKRKAVALQEFRLAGFDERFLPRIIDDLRGRRSARQSRAVELMLTTIAHSVTP